MVRVYDPRCCQTLCHIGGFHSVSAGWQARAWHGGRYGVGCGGQRTGQVCLSSENSRMLRPNALPSLCDRACMHKCHAARRRCRPEPHVPIASKLVCKQSVTDSTSFTLSTRGLLLSAGHHDQSVVKTSAHSETAHHREQLRTSTLKNCTRCAWSSAVSSATMPTSSSTRCSGLLMSSRCARRPQYDAGSGRSIRTCICACLYRQLLLEKTAAPSANETARLRIRMQLR